MSTPPPRIFDSNWWWLLVPAGWAAWLWLSTPDEPYNPAIYPAFRAVEDRCLAEQYPHQTVRCRTVIDLMQNCQRSDLSCTADDYHEALTAAGFDLPTLRRPKP